MNVSHTVGVPIENSMWDHNFHIEYIFHIKDLRFWSLFISRSEIYYIYSLRETNFWMDYIWYIEGVLFSEWIFNFDTLSIDFRIDFDFFKLYAIINTMYSLINEKWKSDDS
jgi:hypothetical protein